MKYPSVFLTVVLVWAVIVSLATILRRPELDFSLYLSAILFTIVIFFIGFWRNA